MVDAKKSVSLHVPLYLQSSFSRGVFKNILWHFNFLWLTYQFQSFPNLENQFLLKSYYFAGAITFQSFPNFLNPSESCRGEVVFIQRHDASLHSKLHQTALKLTPNYWHFLPEPCITILCFWEVLGQNQSWLRAMQTDSWKLCINYLIFEFATACPKIKILHMHKNVIVFLWSSIKSTSSYFLLPVSSEHTDFVREFEQDSVGTYFIANGYSTVQITSNKGVNCKNTHKNITHRMWLKSCVTLRTWNDFGPHGFKVKSVSPKVSCTIFPFTGISRGDPW